MKSSYIKKPGPVKAMYSIRLENSVLRIRASFAELLVFLSFLDLSWRKKCHS